MPAIDLSNFLGIRPAADPRRLAPVEATVATDVSFEDGNIQGLREPLAVSTHTRSGVMKALHRFGRDATDDTNYWFTSTNAVDFVRNPAADDTTERTYFTGDGAPKVTDASIATSSSPYPAQWYALGLPIPAPPVVTVVNNPLVSLVDSSGVMLGTTQYEHGLLAGQKIKLTGFSPTEFNATVTITEVPTPSTFKAAYPTGASGTPDILGNWAVPDDVADSRSYVYTWLSAWTEEGPPCEPVTVSVMKNQKVLITDMETTPAGDGPYNVDRKRVYRTISGQRSTTFFRIAQLTAATTSLIDNATYVGSTANILESADYLPPPADMHSLQLMNNGIGVAVSGDNTVCFSEMYRLHAYPQKYRKSTDYKAVGVAAFGSYAAILTRGTPYLVTGTQPANMSMVPVQGGPACVSKRSIASTGDGAFYASAEGLAYIDRSGANIVTAGIFTDVQWRALNPASIHGVFYSGAYIFFYDTGAQRGSYMLVPGQPPLLVKLSDWYEATYVDDKFGYLYGVLNGTVYRIDAATTRKSYVWASKDYEYPQPTNFSYARVEAEGNITLKVYADGILRTTRTVTDNEVFRLAGGFMARVWRLQVEGSAKVKHITVGHSAEDIVAARAQAS